MAMLNLKYESHPGCLTSHYCGYEVHDHGVLDQSLLLVVSQGGELGRTAGLPYKFEFYLRSRTETGPNAVVGAAPAASPTLQHVALTLPPPVSALRPKP